MNIYIVTMKHDNGVVRLKIHAASKGGAIYVACEAENAPRGAVVRCKQVQAKGATR